MIDFLKKLFDSDFLSHGHCYFWRPEIVWLHVGSDATIALAYLLIPVSLGYFVRKRRDLAFHWMFVMFGAFILACGATHAMAIWTLWHATYRLEGVLKLITAIVSLSTAILLVRLVPRLLALPSPAQMAAANQKLEEANRKLKETQSQLIQTEKMASLGQLVAGIAHEINNPLAFVVSNLYTVETGLDRITPEAEPHLSERSLARMRKVRTRLREMGEGLDRIKELVGNLRTFSRLDEGEFKTIDIGDSIDSVLVLLKHKMSGRIQVERRYGPERSLSCYAGRLNQVFMNLIANAADAIHGKGKIVITTGQTDDAYRISVRDTGKGIPEAIRGRIFDPFFTDKPIGQGTGLGLAISYGIVQDHHGTIEVQSQEGAGSEFTIRIPRDLESRRHE
jgi:two-component system NtrC family sensor kinase